VIPLYFGQFAFFTAVFVMTFFGALVVKRLRPLNPREVLLMTLAVAAGTNLFMNTFLAGTHERYLYHYGFFVYPLLLSLVRTSFFSKALFALCLMHLCIYGCFVFKVFIFNLESPLTKYAQQTVALANVVSSFVALWLVTQAARRRAPKDLA
jgi:predicted permease